MTGNRTIIGVMAALIVLLGVGAAVGGSSKKSPPKSFIAGGSFRAVVVPTDVPRTVVVPPCNAPAKGAAAVGTPGATALRLPAGSGMRTVLVPQCAAANGTQLNGAVNTASAAFILKPDQQVRTGPHLVVPTESDTKTIVVAPCPAGVAGPQRETVLTPRAGTAVAPPC